MERALKEERYFPAELLRRELSTGTVSARYVKWQAQSPEKEFYLLIYSFQLFLAANSHHPQLLQRLLPHADTGLITSAVLQVPDLAEADVVS